MAAATSTVSSQPASNGPVLTITGSVRGIETREGRDLRVRRIVAQRSVLVALNRDRARVHAVFRRVGGELLVGDLAAAGEIDLLRGDQPDLVDQPRQHAHGIGAAGKAEQVDVVAAGIVLDEEFLSGEHVVIEPVAGEEPQDRVELLA